MPLETRPGKNADKSYSRARENTQRDMTLKHLIMRKLVSMSRIHRCVRFHTQTFANIIVIRDEILGT